MSDLVITITTITEADYDGVNETTKRVTATLDLKPIDLNVIEEDTVTDSVCKTNFRTNLTDLGYIWDTEDGV
ncbi:MAG: hypothetical protein E2O29_02075 [Deltaproteobacteria bacterium]|nr:MAG: hypothetical protein E2O29_02075 [Deltaproteobacteria bacterium]